MSNYAQITFFAPKDALLSGNPAKLIKGADVDPELAAIAVAIASKYDSTNFAFANPSATIGLAAVNGSATTPMRSDAAPALSQAIAPTWTGKHTFVSAGAGDPIIFGNSGAAANNKNNGIHVGSNFVQIGTATDAGVFSNPAFEWDRSGLNVTSLFFGNGSDNPTYNFLGTGTAQFGGLLQAKDQSGTFQDVGWRDVPQNLQGSTYTLVMADRGKSVYTAGNITIPANASVAFPLGTAITIITATVPVTIAITSDTLFWSGTGGSSGTRNLAARSMVTIVKTDATVWQISGAGLS